MEEKERIYQNLKGSEKEINGRNMNNRMSTYPVVNYEWITRILNTKDL